MKVSLLRRQSHLWRVLWFATVFGARSSLGHAQEVEQPISCGTDPFYAGVEAFDASDYPRALVCFRETLEELQNPAIRYNIATCHDLMDQLPEARNELMIYLRDTVPELISEQRRQRVENRLAQLDERVALLDLDINSPGARVFIDGVRMEARTPLRTTWAVRPGAHRVEVQGECLLPYVHSVYCESGRRYQVTFSSDPQLGTLEFSGLPEGTTISVDENLEGVIPHVVSVEVEAGEHTIELTLAGYQPYRDSISVECSERVNISPEFFPDQESLVALIEDGSDDGTVRSRRRLSPAWFGVTLGLSTALAISGIITGALVYERGDEFVDEARQCTTGVPQACATSRELANEGESLGRASTALFISSGAVAVAALIVSFFTNWRREHRQILTRNHGSLTLSHLRFALPISSGFQTIGTFSF